MNTDSGFWIGRAHRVCQDYAGHGWEAIAPGRRIHYAALADGCSGSPHTDYGARILVRAFVRAVAEGYAPQLDTGDAAGLRRLAAPELERAIVRHTVRMVRALDLDPTSLDATLPGVVGDADRIAVFMWGDGFLHARMERADEAREAFVQVEFERSAPYYLSYRLDPARRRAYHRDVGWPSGVRIRRGCDCVGGDGRPAADECISWYQEWVREPGSRLTVTLCSDGLAAMADDRNRTLPAATLLSELAAYKSLHGEFVNRRTIRFLK